MTALPPPPDGPAQDAAAHAVLEAIVIGAGFGGICMGVALRRAGVEDFLILEKGHDLGGVWRDNTYPGAACDVPSHLYSFSFAPHPGWSSTFGRQGEIHAYLRDCAARFSLNGHIRHGAAVAGARFDEEVLAGAVADLLASGPVHQIGHVGEPSTVASVGSACASTRAIN